METRSEDAGKQSPLLSMLRAVIIGVVYENPVNFLSIWLVIAEM